MSRRLGHGGAGIVYEAYDRELGVRVALKRLRRLSPDAILRFKSEFRSVEDVEHPNLVALGELFFDVLAQAQIDLYEGTATRAAARTEKAYSALRRAMLLRVQFVRVETIELRARTTLAVAVGAAAAGAGSRNGRHRASARALAEVQRGTDALRAEDAPWAAALAGLLDAGALAAREDAPMPAAFVSAARAFDGVGMALHAAVARARAGGSDGIEGISWLRSQGVVAPDRLVAMLSPGAK